MLSAVIFVAALSVNILVTTTQLPIMLSSAAIFVGTLRVKILLTPTQLPTRQPTPEDCAIALSVHSYKRANDESLFELLQRILGLSYC